MDRLSLRLQAYDGHPVPENLVEAVSLEVDPGAKVDLDQLAEEIHGDLGPRPRVMRREYQESAWGASAAQAIITVSTTAAAFGGLATAFDVIARRVERRGRGTIRPSSSPADSARGMAARCLNIGADDIRVVSLEPVGDGHRVGLETRLGSFTVEIDEHGVSRLNRS